MAAISSLGNGVGYLYITDSNNTILSTYDNTAINVRPFLSDALVSSPLSGEVLSSSTLLIASSSDPSATITSVVINGVTITSGTSTGATAPILIANAVTNINNYISTPDYTAYAVTGGMVVQALAGTGSTPNGYVTAVNGANLVKTTPVMSGGATTSGVYSTAANGHRYYIYADAAAVVGNISGATEVSSLVIARSSLAGQVVSSATIATGVISPIRSAQTQQYIVDTQAAAASDDLDTISTSGFVNGDILEIRGASAARIVTVKDDTGNIKLANNVDFLTGDSTYSIFVQYVSTLDKWVEIFRTPGLDFSTASIRLQSIPWPTPGVEVTTLTDGGGTINLVAGTDKGVQFFDGSPTLVGGWVIQGSGSPIDGDTFHIIYRTTANVNGQTVTIFGATLTDTQATSGLVDVISTYSATNTAWETTVINSANGIDYATSTQLATKEDSLGNPGVDGYVLSSSSSGSRSWIPQPGSTIRGQIAITLSGTAYSGSIASGDTGYIDGNVYWVKPNADSVEGATLNLDSIGAHNIVKQGNVRINIGDLIANRWYALTYNSSLTAFEVNLPRIITAEYDFSALTGVVGSYDLTSDIPTGVVLHTSRTNIILRTVMTSAGSALTSWGATSITDLIDATRPYSSRRYINGANMLFQANSLPYGSFTITAGAGGTIDTVTVAGVNILNGTVAFSVSLTITAANVAANINTNPNSTMRADSMGAVVYLYEVFINRSQGAYSGAGAEYAVSATATTMSVGTFVDIGAANVARNNYDAGYYVPSAKRITFTISGANLTAGKLRAFIPYDVIQ